MERDLECGVGHVLGVDRFLKTQAGRLSGGEKKRLSTAAALYGCADILILEELCESRGDSSFNVP